MNGKVRAEGRLITVPQVLVLEAILLNIFMNDLDSENKSVLMYLEGKRQGSIVTKGEDQDMLQKWPVVLRPAIRNMKCSNIVNFKVCCDTFKVTCSKIKNNFCSEEDFISWKQLKNKRDDPVYYFIIGQL